MNQFNEAINTQIQQEIARHSTELGLYALILIIFLFIWISKIIDALKSNFKDPTNKTTWIILLILAPPIGTVLYIIFAYQQKVFKSDILDNKPFIPEENERDWSFK